MDKHKALVKAVESAIRNLDIALDDNGLSISSSEIECVWSDLKEAIAEDRKYRGGLDDCEYL